MGTESRAVCSSVPVLSIALSNEVSPSDAVRFDAGGKFAGRASRSAQTYSYSDSRGRRYKKTVTAKDGVVTGITP